MTSSTISPAITWHHFRLLWQQYIAPQWRLLTLLTSCLIATIVLQLLLPYLVGRFVAVVAGKGLTNTLFILATLYVCAAFAAQAVRVAEAYVAERLAWMATNALRVDVVRHCLHLDLAFHHEHTPGELLERIDGDTGMLSNFCSRFVLVLLNSTFLTACMLFVILWLEWRIGLPLLIYACCYLLVTIGLARVAPPYFVRARQCEAELAGFLEEYLAATEDIRANGFVPYVLKRFAFFQRRRFHALKNAELVRQGVRGVRLLLYILGTVAVLALDGYLYLTGQIGLATVYLIFAYTMQLWGPLREITDQMGDFQQATAGLLRLNSLLQTQTSLSDGELTQLPPGPLSVCFENVDFGYQPEKPILTDISFTLAPGQILGILGRTGSGKSTLAHLLFRFYDPVQGSISINGVDLKQVRLSVLRSRIALVTQDVQLFHASLRANLTLFNQDISDSALQQALASLGLWKWVQSLPQGLETLLGAGNAALSAGQAQLIALTRVFLSDPDLIILDEASSRLDSLTEALLEQALDTLLHGRTALIIAHRLTTLNRAHEIMLLEQGCIREYGSREQLLLKQDSRYARLLHDVMMEDNTI